jgi:hypothetical protein
VVSFFFDRRGEAARLRLKRTGDHMKRNSEKDSKITQEFLRERFRYLPEGRLERLDYGNRPTGTKVSNGYRRISLRISGRIVGCQEHRLVFLYHHGYVPEYVDHINRSRLDNRIENLRAVSYRENCYNSRRKNNTSSYSGVSFRKDRLSWRAYIHAEYAAIHVGTFATELQASIARDIEVVRENLHKFSPLNHPDLLSVYGYLLSRSQETSALLSQQALFMKHLSEVL